MAVVSDPSDEPEAGPHPAVAILALGWFVGVVVWSFWDGGLWDMVSHAQASLLSGRYYIVVSLLVCALVAVAPGFVLGGLSPNAPQKPQPNPPGVILATGPQRHHPLNWPEPRILVFEEGSVQLRRGQHELRVPVAAFRATGSPVISDTGRVVWRSDEETCAQVRGLDPDSHFFKHLEDHRFRVELGAGASQTWQAIQSCDA